MANFKNLIQKLPKQDIHLHLDGSIRLGTIIELAKEQKIKLPSYTQEGLEKTLFKDNYNNLEEYLKTFGYSCAVMQTPENLERIAYELAIDCQEEGIKYIEVRMDPLLVSNSIQSNLDALQSIHRGLEKAKKEYNNQTGKEVNFHYAMIVCILRSVGKWSEHYRKIFESLPNLSEKQIAKTASLEQIRCALLAREKGVPIVALDLAGAEFGNPCGDFQEAFNIAKEHCLQKIVHAGEAASAQSIYDAVRLLGATRIGHGTALFDTNLLLEIKNKQKFIDSLVGTIRRKKIPIEVCLTSNLQTLPKIKKIQNHSYIQMLENNLDIIICSDNRTVSKTTITDELMLAREGYSFSPKQFKDLVLKGFHKSFFPDSDVLGSEVKKQDFIKSCEKYYDKVTKNTELAVENSILKTPLLS